MSKSDDDPVSEVVWESPPRSQRGRYDWPKIASQLEQRPGEWAKIFDHGRTSIVNAIRQGAVIALLPDRGFEVRTRNNIRYPTRLCSLYLRYVPEKDRRK
jgi:hypothetical protein